MRSHRLPPSSTAARAASCFTDSLTRLDFLKLDSACWDFRGASKSFAASALSIAVQTSTLFLLDVPFHRISVFHLPCLVPVKTLTSLSIFFSSTFALLSDGKRIVSTIGEDRRRIGRVLIVARIKRIDDSY